MGNCCGNDGKEEIPEPDKFVGSLYASEVLSSNEKKLEEDSSTISTVRNVIERFETEIQRNQETRRIRLRKRTRTSTDEPELIQEPLTSDEDSLMWDMEEEGEGDEEEMKLFMDSSDLSDDEEVVKTKLFIEGLLERKIHSQYYYYGSAYQTIQSNPVQQPLHKRKKLESFLIKILESIERNKMKEDQSYEDHCEHNPRSYDFNQSPVLTDDEKVILNLLTSKGPVEGFGFGYESSFLLDFIGSQKKSSLSILTFPDEKMKIYQKIKELKDLVVNILPNEEEEEEEEGEEEESEEEEEEEWNEEYNLYLLPICHDLITKRKSKNEPEQEEKEKRLIGEEEEEVEVEISTEKVASLKSSIEKAEREVREVRRLAIRKLSPSTTLEEMRNIFMIYFFGITEPVVVSPTSSRLGKTGLYKCIFPGSGIEYFGSFKNNRMEGLGFLFIPTTTNNKNYTSIFIGNFKNGQVDGRFQLFYCNDQNKSNFCATGVIRRDLSLMDNPLFVDLKNKFEGDADSDSYSSDGFEDNIDVVGPFAQRMNNNSNKNKKNINDFLMTQKNLVVESLQVLDFQDHSLFEGSEIIVMNKRNPLKSPMKVYQIGRLHHTHKERKIQMIGKFNMNREFLGCLFFDKNNNNNEEEVEEVHNDFLDEKEGEEEDEYENLEYYKFRTFMMDRFSLQAVGETCQHGIKSWKFDDNNKRMGFIYPSLLDLLHDELDGFTMVCEQQQQQQQNEDPRNFLFHKAMESMDHFNFNGLNYKNFEVLKYISVSRNGFPLMKYILESYFDGDKGSIEKYFHRKIMIKHGDDLSARYRPFFSPSEKEYDEWIFFFPLMKKNYEMVKLLIRHIDPNNLYSRRNQSSSDDGDEEDAKYGKTLLVDCIENDIWEIFHFLTSNCDVLELDIEKGRTVVERYSYYLGTYERDSSPLQRAYELSKFRMFKVLYDIGADISRLVSSIIYADNKKKKEEEELKRKKKEEEKEGEEQDNDNNNKKSETEKTETQRRIDDMMREGPLKLWGVENHMMFPKYFRKKYVWSLLLLYLPEEIIGLILSYIPLFEVLDEPESITSSSSSSDSDVIEVEDDDSDSGFEEYNEELWNQAQPQLTPEVVVGGEWNEEEEEEPEEEGEYDSIWDD